jgi:glutamate-1-semialdehyde aminotransferase/acyl carrier protein
MGKSRAAGSSGASSGASGTIKAVKPYDTAQTDMALAPALVDEYTRQHTASREYIDTYRPYLCDNRNISGFSAPYKDTIHPIVAKEGLGSHFTDLDGNRLIDVAGGFGPILFGHNPSAVRDAISKMMTDNAFVLGCEHEVVGECSEKFCQVTGNERVTWVNTGTEATTLAMRLCKLHTGKKKVVMFLGSYHGHFDGFLGMPSSLATPDQCFATAPGIARGFVEDLVVLEYDAVESLEWIDEHSGEIAGVFCETVHNRNPAVVPKAFLQKLRALASARGMVLVFDEVVTGFRIGPGGSQQQLGIRADLVTYGKALGGGMPVGALGGRAEVMAGVDGGVWRYGDASAPEGRRTYFAGTMCKHPLVMTAVRAVLDQILEHGDVLYTALNATIARLASSVNSWWAEQQLDLRVDHYGSQFKFMVPPQVATAFFQTLKMNGVYTWEGRTCFLYTTHTKEDADRIVDAVKRTTLSLLEHNLALPTIDAKATVATTADKTRKIVEFTVKQDLKQALAVGGSRKRIGNGIRQQQSCSPAPTLAEQPAPQAAVCAEAQGSEFVEILASLPLHERVTEAEAILLDMVVELTGAPSGAITAETPLMEAGMDSVAAAEFATQMKELTHMTISDAAAFENPTPAALANHLLTVTGLMSNGPIVDASKSIVRPPDTIASVAVVSAKQAGFGEAAQMPTLLVHHESEDSSSTIARLDLRTLSSLAASYQIEVTTTGLIKLRGPKEPPTRRATPTLLIMHTIMGNTRSWTGLCNRALRSHEIWTTQHDPLQPMDPGGFLLFQTLAQRYAKKIVHCAATSMDMPNGTSMDMLGVSNGTGLVHQTAHALRNLGGRPGRMVLLDPSPGARPQKPIELISYSLAAQSVLAVYDVPYTEDEVDPIRDQDMLAFLVERIQAHRGAGAPSTGRLMQEMQSIRQLGTAELNFYFTNSEEVVPYAHANGEAAIDLILSSEEADIEARYEDGHPPEGQAGRPSVRTFFGKVVRELVVTGDHLTVSAQVTGGRNPAFNDLFDDA